MMIDLLNNFEKIKSPSNHVIHAHLRDGWAVRKSTASRASRVFKTKKEAIDYGIKISNAQNIPLYVHELNGMVADKITPLDKNTQRHEIVKAVMAGMLSKKVTPLDKNAEIRAAAKTAEMLKQEMQRLIKPLDKSTQRCATKTVKIKIPS
jgi:hypothetical protein